MFESFPNFLAGLCAVCFLFCWFFPVALCILVVLVSFALQLIFFCPPLAILTSAMPCLRSKDYGVFSFLDKDPQQRADPSFQGHVGAWHEIGWVRAFLICCVLTCFGFFPGVLFAASMSMYHLLRFWSH
jgi:hypothetical protein